MNLFSNNIAPDFKSPMINIFSHTECYSFKKEIKKTYMQLTHHWNFFTTLSFPKLPYSYFIYGRCIKSNSLLEVLPRLLLSDFGGFFSSLHSETSCCLLCTKKMMINNMNMKIFSTYI